MAERAKDPRPAARAKPDDSSGLTSERRFAGHLSDRYDLWRVARPHLGTIHRAVSDQVTRLAKTQDGSVHAIDLGCGDGAITALLLDDEHIDAASTMSRR